jgi:phosphoenolpyruvate carboxylase
VLVHTLKSPIEAELRLNPDHQAAVETLARHSFQAYRGLAEDGALLDYFHAASPVDELAHLKIGSRPARRFGARGIDDLRAIPWVFAWSQNRHLVTGWYGLGTALEAFLAAEGPAGLKLLREMFRRSRGFRLALDEVEKSLYLADMEIAGHYAELCEDRAGAARIYGLVCAEYERTIDAVLRVSEAPQLVERFIGFRRRFDRVRPLIGQANRWQVDLLRETRSGASPRSLKHLLLTMNCIAAGLGWTG